ncbi:hypothetical protein [Streptomyces tunisiensis]|uniref:hypothetical protein n=1 Tax=Streptomyces tunisiensis TaxID=948699 RepID=UPI003EE070A7
MVDRLSEEVLRGIRELTELTTMTLKSHGFSPTFGELGGFSVEIDAGDDEVGGVYITWTLPNSIFSEVKELIQSQELESPFLARVAQHSSRMQKALADALQLSGFLVEVEDDMRPFGIRVISQEHHEALHLARGMPMNEVTTAEGLAGRTADAETITHVVGNV